MFFLLYFWLAKTLGFFPRIFVDEQVILGTVSLGPPDPRIASDAFLVHFFWGAGVG